MKEYSGLEVAIIGMSGRFPGASNLDAFWRNLKDGVESVSFFTDKELEEAGEDKTLLMHPDYVKANSHLEGKEYFDAGFFNYRPNEAKIMDPQIRIFHECVWEAIEDAGLDLKEKKNKVGVFAGAATNVNWQVFAELVNQDGAVDDYTASQVSNARFLATKLSYAFNLKGPSVFVDTACSSSLAAVQQACRSLLIGDCNVAIAGGIRITNKDKKGYIYTEGMIHSRDGHCRAFDAESSGTISGEGAGVVILKTLKNALKDGDHIWAVIKGAAINNDGSGKMGFTAPSVDGQAEVIMMAHKWAKVEPESIGMIEAHGTGTILGDPIEIEGLSKAFNTSLRQFCAVGSVKTNIGHLDVAAGIAGLIKAVLSIKHRQIPPSLHYKVPNPKIDFGAGPFYVNNSLRPWENDKYPLRAGVSSFGIGGTNVHLVLEEAPAPSISSQGEQKLLVFSAKTPNALNNNVSRFKDYLKDNQELNLADAAFTMQTGRAHFGFRKMVVCAGTEEAAEKMDEAFINAEAHEATTGKNIVFMFTGQGAQYAGMYKGLYSREPQYAAILDKCLALAEKISGSSWIPVLFGEGGSEDLINQTRYAQPALFMTEYALTCLLMEWGIQPDMLIGHSIGEYVAACISGVFSLEDALELVINRGVLMQQAEKGSMLSVSASANSLQSLLGDFPAVSIAAINSSELLVLSGPSGDMEQIRLKIEEAGFQCKKLITSHAFHSAMMNGILDEFESVAARVTFNKQTIPVISNLTGKPALDEELSDAKYWAKHLRQAVRFSDGIENVLAMDRAIFIEIGPGQTLSTFVRSNRNRTKGHQVVSMVRKQAEPADDVRYLLNAVGMLWLWGVQPSWENLYKGQKRNKLSLPAYAFEKVAYPVNVDAYKMIAKFMGNGQPVLSVNGAEEISREDRRSGVMPAHQQDPGVAKLVSLWNDFFGKNSITAEDDFFEVGGDSLKALTMTNHLHKIYGVNVSVKAFFEHSTPARLWKFIEECSNSNGQEQHGNTYADIPRSARSNYYKLSAAQRRLYFLYEFDRTSLAYNMLQAVTMKGKLDKEKLESVFSALLARHDSLRTTFVMMDDEPVQYVSEKTDFRISYYDPGHLDVEEIVLGFVKPFDLNKDVLIRVGVINISDEEHILMTDMHHIVSDGVSQGVLIRDFMSLYNGNDPEPLQLQYADFSEWQQSDAQKNTNGQQKDFWLQEFSNKPESLELPADFVRPAVKSYEGDVLGFNIGEMECQQLKRIAEAEKSTMFMVLLAIYNILLYKLTGKEDLVVGTPSSGRMHAGLDKLIGMFVNMVPVRNRIDRNKSYKQLLADLKDKTLACFDHQGFTYDSLVDELKLDRNTSHDMLFETVFSFENFGDTALEIPGMELIPYSFKRKVSKFDISLTAVETKAGMALQFEYATSLFKKETIQTFARVFQRIVSMVAATPDIEIGRIEMVDASEKNKLIDQLDFTSATYPGDKTIIDYFEEQAACQPDAVAVDCYGQVISYRELNEKANGLAHCLLVRGAKPETIIALLLDRSIDMIVAMLGVLKSGAAYLPLDKEAAVERNRFLMADSAAGLLITSSDLAETLETDTDKVLLIDKLSKELLPTANPIVAREQHHLCYVIYTSGTTGRPKGVMISHGNLISLLFNNKFQFDFDSSDVWTMFHRYCFDFSVWELFGALSRGGKVIIVSKQDTIDPYAFLQLIKEKKVTVLCQTPTAFYNLAQANFEGDGLDLNVRYIIFGGEQLNVSKLKNWMRRYPGTRIINMYGITETTVHNTYKQITPSDVEAGVSNIGTPLPTLIGYVLDKDLNLVPAGLPGELFVGGAGVARGYINNVQLTSQRFIADPYRKASRLYKSGDGVKLGDEGELEYKGRLDNQVQLNGFRIELGEIESALIKYRFIKEVKVLYKENEGNPFLIAYYISDKEIATSHLRAVLAEKLPAYMIPSYFVRIERMPLTLNGKINVAELPEPEVVISREYAQPTTITELRLTEVWMRVLGLPRIGVTDNYFSLGGDSIKAIRLINQISNYLNVKIGIVDLYNHQTIAELSGYIESVKSGSYESYEAEVEADIVSFGQKYLEKHFDERIEAVYPMSNIEKGMCFVQMKHPEDHLYYEQLAWPVFYEHFDIAVVRKAMALLAQRHASFRTLLDIKEFAHIIYKEIDMDIPYTDLSLIDRKEQEDFIRNELKLSRKKKFQLDNEPLWKMAVYKIAENIHFMTFDIHHAVSDGWSISTFLNELNNTYAELKVNSNYLPAPLKTGYKEFITREMAYDRDPNNIKFWQDELEGFKKITFGHNGNKNEYKLLRKIFDDDQYQGLLGMSERSNMSMKTVLFAACMYAIKVMNYENDITVGLVTFNRDIGEDGENVFGNFLNTIPVRMIFDKVPTGAALIASADSKLRQIRPYDSTSLFNINRALKEYEYGDNPITDILFNYTDFHSSYELSLQKEMREESALDISNFVRGNTRFDINIKKGVEGCDVSYTFVSSFIDTDQVERFHSIYMRIIDLMLEDMSMELKPGCLISEAERVKLFEDFNDTEASFPADKTILDLIGGQTLLHGNRAAIAADGKEISYAELSAMSAALAGRIRRMGLGRNSIIGISAERSFEMMIGILGIMKAGHAYMPIDTGNPPERNAYMLENANVQVVLLDDDRRTNFPEWVFKINLKDQDLYHNDDSQDQVSLPCPEDVAYVIYTSGSTGRPKGVLISHRALVNRLNWMQKAYPISHEDVLLQKTPYTFDVSVWELFWGLTQGAKLVMLEPQGEKNPWKIADTIVHSKVSVIHFVPSMLNVFLKYINREDFSLTRMKTLRYVFASGEALPVQLVNRFNQLLYQDMGIKLINLYGPTEATVDVSYFNCYSDIPMSKVPIGKPIDNIRLYILDKNLEILPVGIAGELYISGVGLAEGYVNNEALTMERFIIHPVAGNERIYKTGDLARWMDDGNIEYLGRADDQVKIRGFRIELGEVEKQLGLHDMIQSAAVIVKEKEGDKVLIAYYVAKDEIADLKEFLAAKLPEYMIPTYFVRLSYIPVTANGKLDRKALPDYEFRKEEFEKPETATEIKLGEIWSQVLDLSPDTIGILDNFFELGGHSLKALELINLIYETMQIELPLKEVFKRVTIKLMAEYIDSQLSLNEYAVPGDAESAEVNQNSMQVII